MRRYLFSPSVEAFFLLCSGNLPKGKEITLLNTGWMADVNPTERWTTAADWWCREFILTQSEISSSVCVSENKDSSNHSPKEMQFFFNCATFVLFVLALQFNDGWPYHCRWEFTSEVRNCCTRCLPILASNGQLHLYFSLFLNYTVKNQDFERDGLWKPHSVYWF